MMNELAPGPRRYKMYLVEMDDDNRERVLSAEIEGATFDHQPHYDDIHSLYSDVPVMSFKTSETVTMEAVLRPRPDGTYFTIENFWEEEEDDD